MSEVSEALTQLLNKMADEIKANIHSVSGKTADSVMVTVEEQGAGILKKVHGEITGDISVMAQETGRGPTVNKGNGSGQTLQQSILSWLGATGIVPRPKQLKNGLFKEVTINQLSWAISMKIHREGNLLYRKGGKSGVISNVVTDQRVNSLIAVFGDTYSKFALNTILK